MNVNVDLVNRSEMGVVNGLRKEGYQRASGFSLNLERLDWNSSDDNSYVLVARYGDQAVATMRGEVIESLGLIERKLECSWNLPFEFPNRVLLLSRAATRLETEMRGLNLLLRLHFLSFAIQRKIPFLLGTFIAGSSREKTLKEIGYQLFENKSGWNESHYRSHSPVTIATLDVNTVGNSALEIGLQKLKMKNLGPTPFNEMDRLRIVDGI